MDSLINLYKISFLQPQLSCLPSWLCLSDKVLIDSNLGVGTSADFDSISASK